MGHFYREPVPKPQCVNFIPRQFARYGLPEDIFLSSFSPIPSTVDYQRAVENGLFPLDADPLLTNKTVMPLTRTKEAYQQFQIMSRAVQHLNEEVRKGRCCAHPQDFRLTLRRTLAALEGNEQFNFSLEADDELRPVTPASPGQFQGRSPTL